jgi:Ni,Fe-hydrogenase maturation factor
MKTILCFGNPYIKGDTKAITLAKQLNMPGWEFRICTHAEDIYNYKNHETIYILDTVQGITEPTIITDIDTLSQPPAISLHDMDLGFFLKLMKATGNLKEVIIIGIPPKMPIEQLTERIPAMLEKI